MLAEETRGTRSAARNVRLFLAEGNMHGLVLATVGNWTGQLFAVPRSRISELLHRSECNRTGIYILEGPDPERAGGKLAYIGEADDVATRLRHHLRTDDKDFFERALAIVSSDDGLTKSHVRYLESQLIRAASAAGSAALTNGTSPPTQKLPEADRADMEVFVEHLRVVLPILGFSLLEEEPSRQSAAAQEDAGPVFVFSTAGVSARARETDAGFVVLAGSAARRRPSGTFPAGYQVMRERLVADGTLVEGPSPDVLRFNCDAVFSSPSAAASIVAARSASGPIEWRLEKTGERYRDWMARRLGVSEDQADRTAPGV